MFQSSRRRWAKLALLLPFLIVVAGCWWDDDDPWDSDILVRNLSNCDLEIVMDDEFIMILDEDEWEWIEDVGKGDHVLEAYDAHTGALVERDQIDLNRYEDYTWTIEEC
jgi:hypothetical protein